MNSAIEFRLADLISDHLEEVQGLVSSKDRYSTFEDYQSFQLLIVRRMILEEQALAFKSADFLLVGEAVYYRDPQRDIFGKFANGYEDLLRCLETFYKINRDIVSGYSGEIEKLEDFLFSREIPSYFMDLWFDLKKDLSRIENYYHRNEIVYREFLKRTANRFQSLNDEFKDIEDGIQFQSSSVKILKTRLESLHHYYDSIKSDRLNKTLLMLTVISGVFLPLNLIVGFFGMNTADMFLQNSPEGTERVLIILGVVLLVCLSGIKVARLIDAYVLRRLLGRYDFYKSISNRLGKIDERFKIG